MSKESAKEIVDQLAKMKDKSFVLADALVHDIELEAVKEMDAFIANYRSILSRMDKTTLYTFKALMDNIMDYTIYVHIHVLKD